MERSYGGSHHPNETELARVLLRGTLLQLYVVKDFVANMDHKSLFELTLEKTPESWKSKLSNFISGALHDTCNIASVTQLKNN